MYNRWINNGELYHYGVKGMKWGVRKQRPNSSGRRTYRTIRKELKKGNSKKAESIAVKEYSKKVNYQLPDPKFSEAYELEEKKTKRLAQKYRKEIYDKELKRNGSAYPTDKAKDKLLEYAIFDVGYDKAQKEVGTKAWDAYLEEYHRTFEKNKSNIKAVIGKYGDKKVSTIDPIFGEKKSITYEEFINTALGSHAYKKKN